MYALAGWVDFVRVCVCVVNSQAKWANHRGLQQREMDRKLEVTMSYAMACVEVRTSQTKYPLHVATGCCCELLRGRPKLQQYCDLKVFGVAAWCCGSS